MGGCRCTFQCCDNSTGTSPGMHFFHFPIRDMSRCEKWAKFSNNLAFLELPLDKLKNKVICEIHFHDKCFMNYKKERLIKSAVPTLLKIKNEIMDLQINDMKQDVDIANTIDPLKIDSLKSSTSPIILNNRKRPFIHNGSTVKDNFKVELSLTDTTTDISIPDYPLKLPKLKPKTYITATLPNTKLTTLRPLKRISGDKKLLNATLVPVKTNIKLVSIKPKPKDKNKIIESSRFLPKNSSLPSSTSISEKIIDPLLPDCHGYNENVVENGAITFIDDTATYIDSTYKLSDIQPTAAISIDSLDKSLFVETSNEHKNQLNEIKDLVMNMISKCDESFNINKKIETDKSKFNMNKIQLFNAIKKYLNPAMVSLLRMELFGTQEREWKSDEKSFSIELLKLGTNTYEYMRDEWRFRLPPKKDVEKWLNDNKEFQDNDLEF